MSTRRALALAGLSFIVASSVGHSFVPRRMAANYGWTASPWFQRQLASFEAPHIYGLLSLLRGSDRINDQAYIRMVATSSLILGLNHFLAIARGETAGVPNLASGTSSVLLGLAGLALARQEGRQRRRRLWMA